MVLSRDLCKWGRGVGATPGESDSVQKHIIGGVRRRTLTKHRSITLVVRSLRQRPADTGTTRATRAVFRSSRLRAAGRPPAIEGGRFAYADCDRHRTAVTARSMVLASSWAYDLLWWRPGSPHQRPAYTRRLLIIEGYITGKNHITATMAGKIEARCGVLLTTTRAEGETVFVLKSSECWE